jgi:hypothetical protein
MPYLRRRPPGDHYYLQRMVNGAHLSASVLYENENNRDSNTLRKRRGRRPRLSHDLTERETKNQRNDDDKLQSS